MTDNTTSFRIVIPALNIIPPDTPSDLYTSSLSYFSSIPWTAALLRQSDTIPFILQCRNPDNPQQDQFFGSTLLSDSTLPHMLSLFTRADPDPGKPVTKVTTLYHIGDGLTGGPSILHGGVTMALVDEAMGSLTELNLALRKRGGAFSTLSVTGTLEIKFLRPILTNSTVVATAWLEESEGRKAKVRCEVRDENGLELATCSSIWVAPKAKM